MPFSCLFRHCFFPVFCWANFIVTKHKCILSTDMKPQALLTTQPVKLSTKVEVKNGVLRVQC